MKIMEVTHDCAIVLNVGLETLTEKQLLASKTKLRRYRARELGRLYGGYEILESKLTVEFYNLLYAVFGDRLLIILDSKVKVLAA